MIKQICVIIGTILVYTTAKPLSVKKVLYAISCGAPSSLRSSTGITYQRDVQTDTDTVVADYALNQEVTSQTIKYTKEPEVYMTERHAYKSFSYKIPLQKEGTYVLIMKFAEMYFKEKGKRVFNIKFGERRVVESLDIVEKVGRYAAYDEYIEFEYTNGELFFKGLPCIGAIQKSHLIVTLEKTMKDNPYVHGIVLYAGSLAETDHADQPDIRKNWEKTQNAAQSKKEEERLRKQEQNSKKKEKVKTRNDHLNELEVEFEQVDFVETKSSGSGFSIKNILVGPIGVVLLSVLFGIFAFVARTLFLNLDSVEYRPVPVYQQETKQSFKSNKVDSKTTTKPKVAKTVKKN